MRSFFLRLRLWLHQFNIVAIWREERRLDREAKLEIVREFCETLRAQSDIATKALGMTEQFLRAFEVTGQPETWVVRDEDEVKSAALRMGLKQEDFDSENNPFSYT